MSLIIAKKCDKNIFILSDTKLTYPFFERNKPEDGVVKSVIIKPNMCISFAGDIDYAIKAFKELSGDNLLIDKVKKILNKYHLQSDLKTEFLIAYGEHENKLIQIKDGITTETNSAWIGSLNGFEKFQLYFHEPDKIPEIDASQLQILHLPTEIKEDQEIYRKMFFAMKGVIQDSDIPEVNGFIIPAIYESNYFRYGLYFQAFRGNIKKQEFLPGIETEVDWLTVAEGSFYINFIGSKKSKLAIHFGDAELGVIYERIENGLMFPKYFKNDEIDFFDILKEDKDVFAGGTTKHTANNFCIKGFSSLKRNNYLQAIIYYDRAMQESSKSWSPMLNGKHNEFKYFSEHLNTRGEFSIFSDQIQLLNSILYHRGLCYFYLKEYKMAIRNFDEALTINKTYWRTFHMRSMAYLNLDMKERAFDDINKSIQFQDKPLEESYFVRGKIYFLTNEFEKAILDFKEALKINPSFANAQNFLVAAENRLRQSQLR